MRPIKNTATVQNELQKSINEVFDWCDKNAMILHPSKTKSMLLATRQNHQFRTLILNLSFKDNRTEQVHEHRHLDVIIDDKFSWRPHITSTCKTILKNKQKNKQTKQNKTTKKLPVVTPHTS